MFGLLLYVAIIVAGVIYGYLSDINDKKPDRLIEFKIDADEKLMEKQIADRILRNKSYDDITRRCKEIAGDGEVYYFSVEDIERIVKELKKRK